MRPIPPAVAIRAANKNVTEKLHFNLLKARSAAPLALALGGVETESAGIEAALFGGFGLREEFPDIIKGTDVNCRIGASRLAENGLVHQHNLAKVLCALQ